MVKLSKPKLEHRPSSSRGDDADSRSDSDGDDPDFHPAEQPTGDIRTTRSGGRRSSNQSNDNSSFNGSYRSSSRLRHDPKSRLLRESSDTDEEDDTTDEESASDSRGDSDDETMDNNGIEGDANSNINGDDGDEEDKNDVNEDASEKRETRRRTQIYSSYNEKYISTSTTRSFEPRQGTRASRRTRHLSSFDDGDDDNVNGIIGQHSNSAQAEDTPSQSRRPGRPTRNYKEPAENSLQNGSSPHIKSEGHSESESLKHESETRRSQRREVIENVGDSLDVEGDMYSRLKGNNSRRKDRRVNYREFLRVATTRAEHEHGGHHNGMDTEPVSRRLRERKSQQLGRDKNGPRPSIDALLHKVRKNRLRRRKRRRSNSSDSGGSRSSSSSSTSSIDGGRRGPNRSRSSPFDKPAKAGSKKEFQDLQPNEVDPSITFQSIGGLSSVIEKLRETVVLPLVYKEFYSTRNITPPKGILFHGPPGTGKTMLARALANECSTLGGQKVTFFVRKGGDLLSKWVGESERQIRKLFEQASISQPSIIFFDEIDGLAPIRSSKTDQVHNSVVSTLLAELDGVKDRGDIIIIGATNRIDSIDSALRRPGRFDHEFAFLLPSLEGRAQILKSHTSKWTGDEVSEKVIEEVAARTVGFSGADLKLLCAEASVIALRRRYPQIYTSTNKYLLDYSSIKVEPVDWIQAMSKIKPSSTRSLNGILTTGHPLPKAVVPLLEHEVVEISKRIASMFPLIECPEFMREPAPKRFLISADHNDNGLDQYILPAILHRFESVPVFTLSLESVVLTDSNVENSAIARVFNEAERINKLAIILIPSFNILLGSMSLQSQTLLCERIMNATSKPIFILATAQLEQLKEKVNDDENNSDHDASTADIPVRFLNFFNGRSYTLSHVPRKTRKAFFLPLLTHQALLVRIEMDVPTHVEELPLAPPPPPKMLSAEQLKSNQKKETSMLRHLRKFLREILWRLFRNKKFQDFIRPIDAVEVPDYYEIIKKPMTFEAMAAKLNQGVYLSAHDLLEDIHLIRDNAVAYNPSTVEGLAIISRSEELVDYANLIIEDEMDSEFEEACQKLANEKKLKEIPKPVKVESTAVVESSNGTPHEGNTTDSCSVVAGSSKTPVSSNNDVKPPGLDQGPSGIENSNSKAVVNKKKTKKRKIKRKNLIASKQRKISTSDTPTLAENLTESTREISQSPDSNSNGSSISSNGSHSSKRSNQSMANEPKASTSSCVDLEDSNPSCKSWSPSNAKLKKCVKFEVYEKCMKKLVSEAATATEGLGVNRILDLRYKLLLLIERQYGQDDKDNLIEEIKEAIKCFVRTEHELQRDPNGVEMEGLEDSESR